MPPLGMPPMGMPPLGLPPLGMPPMERPPLGLPPLGMPLMGMLLLGLDAILSLTFRLTCVNTGWCSCCFHSGRVSSRRFRKWFCGTVLFVLVVQAVRPSVANPSSWDAGLEVIPFRDTFPTVKLFRGVAIWVELFKINDVVS